MFTLHGFRNVPRHQVLAAKGSQSDSDCLAKISAFPVFMGCVEHDPVKDRFADMRWTRTSRRAPVVVEPVLPLEMIYQNNHNDAVGELWARHHTLFGQYVAANMIGREVYEIGGAHGLASIAAGRLRKVSWTIHDLNPTPFEGYVGGMIRGAFTKESARLPQSCETVAHSHTLEHVHDAARFIEDIAAILPVGGRQIISWPNMRKMLERSDLNFLNFEHTAYLPEDVVSVLLENKGFRIIDTTYFGAHSIFMCAEKVGEPQMTPPLKLSESDSLLFERYFVALEDTVKRINSRLRSHDGAKYVFGAHVFTQMLIAAGLHSDLLVGCLDNSPAKSGKRLYGTNLYSSVPSREILSGQAEASMVVMAVAEYADEIERQLMSLSEGTCTVVV